MKTKIKPVVFNPIGVIYSPFKDMEGMPIQPVGAKGIKGEIHLKKEYMEGLSDLEGFSHIILIYHFHLSKGYLLKVKPFLDNMKRGIFATRAPRRPNSIGLSVINLDKIEGNIIHISNVDIVNGTPLLDIKPYMPYFDKFDDEKLKIGWFEDKYKEVINKKSDMRFLQ
ncbi:tRNA (N6-threonylcarbamoyladenosine(37)-N6)-methyltransferase TrmO [Methanobacterium sp.]|uniref:tRNA (N6-threonylcarbamoyladenosine(37)-N6)-methyltransferase TrmO n=1 Tax=Methanobacterium sp. TaxID=2164 RepID=UPI003C73DC9C